MKKLQQSTELFNLHLIRVLAIFGIVFYHSSILLEYYGGIGAPYYYLKSLYAGVDFLFVLSGFLMYHLYNHFIGTNRSIAAFLFKRVIRIYPLYILLTLCVIPIYFMFPGLGEGYERDPFTIIKSLLLWPDFYPILSVGWTLTYQIYFYFLFALLFSKKLRVIFFLVMGLSVLGFFFKFSSFWFNFYNLEFLLGMAAAISLQKFPSIKTSYVLGAGCLLLLLSIGIDTTFEQVLKSEKRVFSYGISALLLTWGLAKTSDLYKEGTASVIRFLSKTSYAIFLSHYLFLAFFIKALFTPSSAYAIPKWLVSVVLSLTIGMFISLVIEKRLTSLVQDKFKHLILSE